MDNFIPNEKNTVIIPWWMVINPTSDWWFERRLSDTISYRCAIPIADDSKNSEWHDVTVFYSKEHLSKDAE